MFNSVEYVREICGIRNIPISQLEKDCGFANGYLNPKKLKRIPYERAKKIAEYLGLSLEYMLDGAEGTKKTPTLEGERLPEPMIILNRAAKNMTPEQQQKLLDMSRLMFKEAFDD